MIKYRWNLVVLVACASCMLVSLLAESASANERHFAYTYETATLPEGNVEFEPWTTLRYGREDYYLREDHRFEFEFGLTDTLQTAFYFNVSAYAQEIPGDPDGDAEATIEKNWKMPGISSEWKWKLSDPVADAVGTALYLEGSLKPHEAELEGKVLLDKRIGDILMAFNAVAEVEWEHEGAEVASKLGFEADAGLAYLFNATWSAGLEMRNVNTMPEMESLEHSVLYAGPTATYGTDKWWATMAVQPQLFAFKGASDDSILDLEEHERVEARIIFGIHL